MLRLPPALLAGLAGSAVLLQLLLTVQLAMFNGKTLVDGLIVFFGYFTILSNIFVALVGTAGALRDRFAWAARLYRVSVVGCATTAIVVVGLGYHLLLRNVWAPQGVRWLADGLLHYVVPLAALWHWLGQRCRGRLGWLAPLAWCTYPSAYVAYALVRGALLDSYPYPFIDVTVLGYPRALRNVGGLLLVFVAIGYAVRALGRPGRVAGAA